MIKIHNTNYYITPETFGILIESYMGKEAREYFEKHFKENDKNDYD